MTDEKRTPVPESRTLWAEIAKEFRAAAGDAQFPITLAIAPQWLREAANALEKAIKDARTSTTVSQKGD